VPVGAFPVNVVVTKTVIGDLPPDDELLPLPDDDELLPLPEEQAAKAVTAAVMATAAKKTVLR
jgi:hypothetical protein